MVLSSCGSGESDPGQAPLLPVQAVDAVRRDVPLSIEMGGGTLGTQDVPIRARGKNK